MAMRLSGLMSGMDTESVIEQLVMAKRTKVDTTRKAQTKLQWKSDIWKTLNTKIKKLYDGALSNLRFEGSYMKKTTKVSNSSVASVITGANAMNGVQTLEVDSLAKSAYLTGGKVGVGDQKGKQDFDSDSRLQKIGGWTFADRGKFNVKVGDKQTEISVTGATTIGELVQAFRDAGVNASFDTANQRFYITSKETGKDNDFTITAGDANGLYMLQDLGLYYVDEATKNKVESIAKMTEEDANKVVESRLQERVEKRKAELINQRNELTSQRDELNDRVEALKTKYADKLNGASSKDDIQARISELMESEGALNDEEKEELLSLGKDLTSLADIQNNIDEISGKFTEEGELTEEVTSSIEREIRIEVDREIASAKAQVQEIADGAHKEDGQEAVIRLNGVEYTGSKNTFEINGLTLTLNATTKDSGPVTITTEDDTDGIYDMIKNFFKEYNELINEMDKLYNAESSKGYEPLTSEEKESMSEKEIEEWETKIKDSLLRRDDTLGTISSAIKQMMLSGVAVNGKTMYLSNFGIETLSYFTAAENEKNAYHINGNPDDPNTSGNADDLKSMIANDPQTVIDFFVGLSRNMYAELTDRMAKTEYSSSYTIYEDVRMKKEYDEYTEKIKQLEKKLSDYEDSWYQKFAKMETALAKLQSGASAVTSLLGG